MADITPDPVMRIALGFMAAKHLFVASAIGLSRGSPVVRRRLTNWSRSAVYRAGPWELAPMR